MQLGIHLDGKCDVYLRIPTLWDDIQKQWIGFIKTPISLKLIYGSGKTSFDLEKSFNKAVHEVFSEGGEIAEELISMFKPLEYWEKTQ